MTKQNVFGDPFDLDASVLGRAWQSKIDLFLDKKEADGCAEKTLRHYRSQLGNLAKRSVANGVGYEAFKARNLRDDAKARLAAGLTESSIRHTAVAARCFFRWLRKNRHLKTDPLVDCAIPKAPRPVKRVPNAHELAHLFRTMADSYKPCLSAGATHASETLNQARARRNVAIVCTAIDTSARLHEVLALRVSDVDLETRVIRFPKLKIQKAHVHAVPISDFLVETLQAWLRIRPKSLGTDLLFVNEANGGPVDPTSFSRIFRRHADAAGLEGVTFHSLRHYSITALALENRVVAQKIAGHASPLTTDLYVHESAEDLRQAHEAASPLRRIFFNARSEAASKRNRPKIY